MKKAQMEYNLAAKRYRHAVGLLERMLVTKKHTIIEHILDENHVLEEGTGPCSPGP